MPGTGIPDGTIWSAPPPARIALPPSLALPTDSEIRGWLGSVTAAAWRCAACCVRESNVSSRSARTGGLPRQLPVSQPQRPAFQRAPRISRGRDLKRVSAVNVRRGCGFLSGRGVTGGDSRARDQRTARLHYPGDGKGRDGKGLRGRCVLAKSRSLQPAGGWQSANRLKVLNNNLLLAIWAHVVHAPQVPMKSTGHQCIQHWPTGSTGKKMVNDRKVS